MFRHGPFNDNYTVGDTDYVTPTHNGSAATGNTRVYTGPVSVAIGTEKFFEAVAYKSGMTDSVFTEFDADNTGGGGNLLLMSPSGSGRSVTYNIDQMGNRTSVIDTGVTTTYTQTGAGLNQYSQVGTNGVSNDNEHELRSYQNISYTYINDERLSSVTGNSNSYQLAYDALGRCVKRTLNNVVTYYIYDGEKPIVEYNSAGSVIGRNLYGRAIDEILMRTDYVVVPSGQTYYYQDDHEGSVTHLLSSSGGLLERYRYDVFGAPSMEDGSGNSLTASAYNNRFMFTGREYRSQFGIYEYRARAYHPGLGRFTGEDPKGFDAGDYNLFRYCHNDPEDLTDPMGLLGDETADKANMQKERMDASQREEAWELRDQVYAPTANSVERQTQRQLARDAFSAEAQRAIAEGQRFAQAGLGDPRQAPATGSDAYRPGQHTVDKAKEWIMQHHPELRAKDYRILDARVRASEGGWAGVPWNNKVYVDSKKWHSEREVVVSAAHELMHRRDGILSGMIPWMHDRIYKESNTIGEEFHDWKGSD